MTQPTQGNQHEGRTSLAQGVLAVMCAAATLGVCAVSVLLALGYSVEAVPGGFPHLVQQAEATTSAMPLAATPTLPATSPTFVPQQVRPPPTAVRQAATRVPALASTRRSSDSHFYFDAIVNGAPLHAMFDTGASSVVLRAEDAARAGVDVGSLAFTASASTANGRSENARVVLESITIGEITVHNVGALVARPGKLGVTLLGQAFMVRLAGYRFDGDQLILQGN